MKSMNYSLFALILCDFSEEVKNGNENLTYCEYLNLDTLLSVQNLLSVEYHQPAHHEHLFIVIHQGNCMSNVKFIVSLYFIMIKIRKMFPVFCIFF